MLSSIHLALHISVPIAFHCWEVSQSMATPHCAGPLTSKYTITSFLYGCCRLCSICIVRVPTLGQILLRSGIAGQGWCVMCNIQAILFYEAASPFCKRKFLLLRLLANTGYFPSCSLRHCRQCAVMLVRHLMNVIDFHDIVLSIGANTTDRAHCRSSHCLGHSDVRQTHRHCCYWCYC